MRAHASAFTWALSAWTLAFVRPSRLACFHVLDSCTLLRLAGWRLLLFAPCRPLSLARARHARVPALGCNMFGVDVLGCQGLGWLGLFAYAWPGLCLPGRWLARRGVSLWPCGSLWDRVFLVPFVTFWVFFVVVSLSRLCCVWSGVQRASSSSYSRDLLFVFAASHCTQHVARGGGFLHPFIVWPSFSFVGAAGRLRRVCFAGVRDVGFSGWPRFGPGFALAYSRYIVIAHHTFYCH